MKGQSFSSSSLLAVLRIAREPAAAAKMTKAWATRSKVRSVHMKTLSLGPMSCVTFMNRSELEENLKAGKGDWAIINAKSAMVSNAAREPAMVILLGFNYLSFSF